MNSAQPVKRLSAPLISLLLAWCTLACGVSADDSNAGTSTIPIPPWIADSELVDLGDGRLQLSFRAEEEYPSSRVRDYYAEWAEENDWTKVPADLEEWSADRWVSYTNAEGVQLDQWSVHWQSPDKAESLRLVLLHSGDRSVQDVLVVRSPFYLLNDEIETSFTGDAVDPSDPCPGGELSEPEPIYRPLPPGGLVRERCVEPLVSPSPLFTINEEGRIGSVTLIRSSGCIYADRELEKCIREWVFRPATCDGQPISVERALALQWDRLDATDSTADLCQPYDAELTND